MKVNYIECGDCLELLKTIPDKSIDLIVTDPPYELETQRGGGFFRESNEKRRKYQDEIESMMMGVSEELLDIIQNLIINSSQENDIVLDPFLGSGTTVVASINTNRQYIGFELDKQYFQTAVNRMLNAYETKEKKNDN